MNWKLEFARAADAESDPITIARTPIETRLTLNEAVLTASNMCVAQYLFRDLLMLVGGGK